MYSEATENTHFSKAQYYDSLSLLELEFQSRVQPMKYSCKVGEVDVTRTILVDCCWEVRQIVHVILTQMHPQIQYRSADDRDSYRLAWYGPQNDHVTPLLQLKMDQTLHEQGINLIDTSQSFELFLVRESDLYE